MFRKAFLVVLFCLISLSVTAPVRAQENDAFGAINGTINYRLRIALPPNAVISVLLDDVTAGEKPVPMVSAVSLPTRGRQVPIPFRLTYFKGDLAENRQYRFNVTITARQAGLLFLGSLNYTVPAGGATDAPVNIMVEQYVQPVAFTATHWTLTELNGKAVPPSEDKRRPYLIFQTDSKVNGSGGINRLMGGYTRKGAMIKFTPAAMTRMAGPPELMAQERAFTLALAAANNYQLTGSFLELRKDVHVLARFTAQTPYP